VDLIADLNRAADELKSARPTAVNLKWAVDRLIDTVQESDEEDPARLRIDLLSAAQQIADEDVDINKRMARHGAELIHDGDTIIHHCNTGALATVDWGTALGVIRMAHQDGKKIHVLVDETRPRLQGSRLTAWELEQYGIPYDIIPDNAAGYYLQTGGAQKVFFGADRVAANGDVANKIGTYKLALAAFDNSVPAYCVAPTSTIDRDTTSGDMIPIEERPQTEVLALTFEGRPVAPEKARARNPAFDITPERLVTAIVTENGIAYPPFLSSLSGLLG
jgi:methylthioribose-1-phosphate isomerase